jgi:hypothetical protein
MNMLLREELVRNLVSLTSQTLFATMVMTNSAFHWVSSTTPVISESLAAVSSAFFGTTLDVESHERESERTTTSATGATPPQEAAYDYYYNAIHTVTLLLVVWIYFKTILVVWRSLSAFWETTKGIWKILGAVGSWLARFVNRWGWLGRRRTEVALAGNSLFDADPSINPPLLPTNNNNTTNSNNNTTQGHSQCSLDEEQQLFLQTQQLLQGTLLSQPPPLLLPPLLPPPPQGAIWYYYNPATHNLVPWFSLPQFPPPLSPMIPMAALVPQALPPQESFFIPISETPRGSEPRDEHMTNTNANTGRAHELSPLFGFPASGVCGLGHQNPDGTTATGTLGMNMDAKATPRETEAGQLAADPANATTVGNAANGNANTTANATEASANRANSKKRKSFSPCGTIQLLEVASDTANANANATEASANRASPKKRKSFSLCCADQLLEAATVTTGHAAEPEAGSDRGPSKKQKRQRAKAKAVAWAKQAFGTTH